LEVDFSFEDTGLMSVARILVRLDLRPRLLKDLTIETTSGSFLQPLNYEGIPFRYHRCHAYGNGVADCKLPFKGKLRSSLDVGVGLGLGHVVSRPGVSKGAQAVASQNMDFGMDSRQPPYSPAGLSSVDRTWLTQRSKSLLCWRSQGLC
jgi:hypothetical protein